MLPAMTASTLPVNRISWPWYLPAYVRLSFMRTVSLSSSGKRSREGSTTERRSADHVQARAYAQACWSLLASAETEAEAESGSLMWYVAMSLSLKSGWSGRSARKATSRDCRGAAAGHGGAQTLSAGIDVVPVLLVV
jgi:hypothetical protein